MPERSFHFSANTGFLWSDLPFLNRIKAAANHGFHGVEFHDEGQSADRIALKEVLAETGLPVQSLNAKLGPTRGRAAIPGAEDAAKRDIDAAIELAEDLGARAIHVPGGVSDAPEAHQTYVAALRHTLAGTNLTVLIEPISNEQQPGFFLRTIEQAARILAEIADDRLKILFDCYHIHSESRDVPGRFRAHADKIGHVQISSAEGRAEPWAGTLDYRELLPEFQNAGYDGMFGCEYRPAGQTEAGLGWMAEVRGDT